ncbi:MAG TPA: hypothetical protein VE993_17710 [Stellaceae bacterium]|nr:hypothetical protein [Stellaceae bacterium]
MGYKLKAKKPWGAVELIAAGTALSDRLRPGFLYGAHDDRRPAGAAAGF